MMALSQNLSFSLCFNGKPCINANKHSSVCFKKNTFPSSSRLEKRTTVAAAASKHNPKKEEKEARNRIFFGLNRIPRTDLFDLNRIPSVDSFDLGPREVWLILVGMKAMALLISHASALTPPPENNSAPATTPPPENNTTSSERSTPLGSVAPATAWDRLIQNVHDGRFYINWKIQICLIIALFSWTKVPMGTFFRVVAAAIACLQGHYEDKSVFVMIAEMLK